MAKTPRAGTGDSVGWFRSYWCSALFNYDKTFSIRGTFSPKLIHLPDNHGLLPTPKETYDLNLSAITREFGHFEPQHGFFVPKNCTILACFHLLLRGGKSTTSTKKKKDMHLDWHLDWHLDHWHLCLHVHQHQHLHRHPPHHRRGLRPPADLHGEWVLWWCPPGRRHHCHSVCSRTEEHG